MKTKRIIRDDDVKMFFNNSINSLENALGLIQLNIISMEIMFSFNALQLLSFKDIIKNKYYKYNSKLFDEDFIKLLVSITSIDIKLNSEVEYIKVIDNISINFTVKMEKVDSENINLYFISNTKLFETEEQLSIFNNIIGVDTSMFAVSTWWIDYDRYRNKFYSSVVGPNLLGIPINKDNLYPTSDFKTVREKASLVSEFFDESIEMESKSYDRANRNETDYFGGRTPVVTSKDKILWVESYGKVLLRYPDGSARFSVAIDFYLSDLFDRSNQLELLSNLVETGLISSDVGIWYHQRHFKVGRYYFTESYQKLMANGKEYKNETVIDLLNEQISIIREKFPEHVHLLTEFRELHNKVYFEGLNKYHTVIPNYKNGTLQWIDVRGTCVERDNKGDVNLFVGANVDVTTSYNRNRELELLRIQNEKLQLAENLAVKARNLMVWYKETLDYDNSRYIFGNVIMEKKLGIPRNKQGLISFKDLKKTFYIDDVESKKNASLVSRELKLVISGKKDSVKKILSKHINLKTKEILYLEHSVEVSISSDGNATRMVGGIMLDVTDNIRYQEKIKFLANYDVLTETYNRNYFEQYIKNNLPHSYTLLVFDLDGLKLTNDVFGHIQGDNIIKKVSDFLKIVYKDSFFVSRIGGDEFVVLSRDVDNKIVTDKIIILESMINDFNEKNKIEMNVSKGAIIVTNNDLAFDKAFVEAENIMYRRKLNNRSSRKSKVLESIIETLNVKTEETKEHSLRLGDLAVKTIKELGLSRSSEVNDMILLSKVHDVGKITVHDNIINKPGKLNKFEFEMIKKHCEAGYNIIRNITDSDRVCNGVLFHHEKWDGTGYPQGLKGDDIPIFARVISVVDTYDAMTNDRIYKSATSHDEAIKEIIRCSGTQFDPYVVAAFLKSCFNQDI